MAVHLYILAGQAQAGGRRGFYAPSTGLGGLWSLWAKARGGG